MPEIQLPPLHKAQQEIFECDSRFIVVNAGRRFGKTVICSLYAVVTMLEGGRVWWLAPTFSMGMEGWVFVKDLVKNIPGIIIREGDKSIRYAYGTGSIQIKSTDDPTRLLGAGLDLAIFDEFSYTLKPEAVWLKSIRPALADRQGRTLFISTPNGHNYFWKLHKQARNKAETEWKYFHFPTAANPFIPASEIEAARNSLPKDIFDQEFMAEFIQDSRGVFRLKDAISPLSPEKEPDPDSIYSLGADFAKHKDFSIFTAYNLTHGRVAQIERFNQLDYRIQMERLKFLIEKYSPTEIWIERNNVGEVLVEELRADYGRRLKEYVATNTTKRSLIENLIIGFEHERIKLPNDKLLLDELKAFKLQRTRTGLVTYAAPYGSHDDMVISLALAVMPTKRSKFRSVGKVYTDNIFYSR